jgi:MFS family permease
MAMVHSYFNVTVLEIVETVGLICSRFVLSGFWALFYVYVAELYPTKVRSMGIGFASAMGTIGSSISPDLIYQSEKIHVNSWIIVGIFGAISFFCAFRLRETLGTTLYDDI